MNNPNIIQSDIKRFNWGVFFLTWIWGIGNNVMETLWILVTGFCSCYRLSTRWTCITNNFWNKRK